ncbi:LOW QUALITY PROTEIN: CD70 isoform 1 [Pan troglodytes]|uniref:CD70 molecule n=2 Tax=Pan troglodytes TaxID=9598 RepID=H2RHT6_PANTR|nr:LOW QUALITY PROTEIN: CD70 isoform 1 [Pan troglodytes]
MPEEGSGCSVRRRPYGCVLRAALVPLVAGLVICLVVCIQRFAQAQQQLPLESLGWDVAELQLNHTGPQQDPRLYWQGGPALGRSFLHGPELDKGQLRIHRDGIYMVHIQVTLAICSSTTASRHHPTTLAVGICSPASRSISLLRLSFHQGLFGFWNWGLKVKCFLRHLIWTAHCFIPLTQLMFMQALQSWRNHHCSHFADEENRGANR